MTAIRRYRESDAPAVGRLIADTYGDFNLGFLPAAERGPFLGPFRYADSPDEEHQREIASTIAAATVLVAEDQGEIVGVLRGRPERLASLFVRADHQRQGIGRKLVARFEELSRQQGVRVIRLAATLYGLPFYLAMGYKRSTGVRVGWSFEGHGLPYQPMRKVLKGDANDAEG